MSEPIPIDLVRLRRSCADCSLGELCLPAGVDRDDLGRLDTLVQRRRPLQRGESLFRAGDPLRSVYVASAGAFKTVVVNASGEEHVLGFHLPGELFGLDAIGSGKHRCEAIALGEAKVCELPFASLSTVAAQLPSLQRQLLRVMGQSADRDHDHVDVLSVIKVAHANADKARHLVARFATDFPAEHPPCPIGSDKALEHAIMTARDARDPALLAKLDAVAGRVLKARG